MMKGVAAALSPLDGVLPASRNALRAAATTKETDWFTAAQPPEAETSDPNLLEPTIYRFILRHSLPQQLILILLP